MSTTRTVDTSRRKLLPRMWQLFAGAWLVFLFVAVVSELREEFTVGRLVALSIWTAVFTAIWLWLMLRNPFRAAEPTPAERQYQIGLLVALAALVIHVNIAYEPGLTWLFIYVLFAAGVTLPTRTAVKAIVLVAIISAIMNAALGRWNELVTQVPGVAAYGFTMVIVRRLVVTVRELDAAREENALLAASEAVAAERLRIARDLHDLLGHSLSLIALKSELAKRLAPLDPQRAVTEITDIERVARQALREVGEAIGGYRRPVLGAELDAARELLAAAGIAAEIDPAPAALPPAIDAVLAWTVREGVTNVIRHSGAQRCRIRLHAEGETVQAEVTDDGSGSAARPAMTGGRGLTGLGERISIVGGRLSTGAARDGGFRLAVTVPLPVGSSAVGNAGEAVGAAPR